MPESVANEAFGSFCHGRFGWSILRSIAFGPDDGSTAVAGSRAQFPRGVDGTHKENRRTKREDRHVVATDFEAAAGGCELRRRKDVVGFPTRCNDWRGSTIPREL